MVWESTVATIRVMKDIMNNAEKRGFTVKRSRTDSLNFGYDVGIYDEGEWVNLILVTRREHPIPYGTSGGQWKVDALGETKRFHDGIEVCHYVNNKIIGLRRNKKGKGWHGDSKGHKVAAIKRKRR